MKHRSARNPLEGISPIDQSAMSQRQPEPPEIEYDYDPSSKSNIMARKAAAEIRRKYGIETGDVKAIEQLLCLIFVDIHAGNRWAR